MKLEPSWNRNGRRAGELAPSACDVQGGFQAGQVRRAEDDTAARGDVDEVEVDPRLRDLARQVRQHAGAVLDLDDDHLALARHRDVRDREGVPRGLRVLDEDVELGLLTRPDARGRRDVHARVADRGRDLSERPGDVLDVDGQVDRHAVGRQPIRRKPGAARDVLQRPMAPRVVILVAVVASLALPAGASAVPVPAMTPPVTVVPSPGLPADVQVDHSNANLAVAYFRGRVFMVFRTAKWQIADDNARLYVVSSVDQVHWRFEGKFAYGRDLREPRLFVWKKKLFLYFALLGSNAAAFEPGGEMATRWIAPGKWVKPRRILPQPDFIAWAVKAHRGKAYMSGYTGGGGTFQPNPPPKYVYWLTTTDGWNWKPIDPARKIVYTGQCGETDFAFMPDGSLVTACQTEEVDKLGWGAKVCTAPARELALWTCRGDPRRLDSPFVFVYQGYAYVIARRQPNFGGNYDLGLPKTPDTDPEFVLYDGTYAATTKRCSLWSIDTKTRTFTPLFDVPGVGDTCYPEMIRQPHGQFLVYNYTSPLDGSDPPWGTALTVGDTLIYRMTLQFG